STSTSTAARRARPCGSYSVGRSSTGGRSTASTNRTARTARAKRTGTARTCIFSKESSGKTPTSIRSAHHRFLKAEGGEEMVERLAYDDVAAYLVRPNVGRVRADRRVPLVERATCGPAFLILDRELDHAVHAPEATECEQSVLRAEGGP